MSSAAGIRAGRAFVEIGAYDAPLSQALRRAQAKLQAFGLGIPLENLLGDLRALGDTSAGNAEKFKRLSLAFGQTQAKGRLMGTEVLQMVVGILQFFSHLQTIYSKRLVATISFQPYFSWLPANKFPIEYRRETEND